MSEKKPTSYYVTSREHGAIRAEFEEHGRDVTARRGVQQTPSKKASVSYLTELNDERKYKMDDRVTQALFNGVGWAMRDPVAGGNEAMRIRSVNLADLKITPNQFRDSVRRILAVMDISPAQIGFDSFGPMQVDVKIRDNVYRENLRLLIESREYAAARNTQEAPSISLTGVRGLPVKTNKISENLSTEESIADQQVAGILIEPHGEWLMREHGKSVKNTRYLSIDCDEVGLSVKSFEESATRVLRSIGVDMQHVRFNYPDAESPYVVEVEMPAWLYSVHRRALEGNVPERGR